ncbi:nuclear transport factor 2 family protein [Rhodoligotrophos ferricapiens]|uniref:nuclear transport factor 2 family protein n=1 Tax=Rhodoligotrophos ferricapiens TaxID=3069264 RepID=UPI00315C77B4
MTPDALLSAFTDAVERRDGRSFAQLFTEDGIYHDAFYGSFQGRARIAELIDDWFHRDAKEFRWDMHDPVTDGRMLYTRYVFSYISTFLEAQGRRVMFEGVAIMRLRDGLIADYREVANTGPALLRTGFPAERVAKILERQGEELAGREEAAGHRG